MTPWAVLVAPRGARGLGPARDRGPGADALGFAVWRPTGRGAWDLRDRGPGADALGFAVWRPARRGALELLSDDAGVVGFGQRRTCMTLAVFAAVVLFVAQPQVTAPASRDAAAPAVKAE